MKGFGKVRYEPPEELRLTRGYEYDVLPDNADPTASALVFDGERYLGEASYQYHTAFDDPEAGGETLKKRANTVKQNRKQLKAIKGELPILPVLPGGETTLLPLPQAENIIKMSPEKQPEPDDNIRIQEDGSILNTQTGELIRPVERPVIPNDAINNEMEELERRRKEIEDKRFADWKAKTSGENHSGGNPNDSDTTPNTTYKERKC